METKQRSVTRRRFGRPISLLCGLALLSGFACVAAQNETSFPPALASYVVSPDASLVEVLKQRIQVEPFNLVATLLFFLAIIHTFMAPMFMRLSHRFEQEHLAGLQKSGQRPLSTARRADVSTKAELFHFLGEVEAIFGIWVVPLMIALSLGKGWGTAQDYLAHRLNFTEPVFVIVIMTIAASRPILKLSERVMDWAAALGGGSRTARWLSILTIGPVLGSFITEPAAMTISALLLAEAFYTLQPSPKLAYATLGLLFVNVSVGGTLTHFAAPPVLMVADKWGWGFSHMLTHFGWKAVTGIVTANLLYLFWFRRDFRELSEARVPFRAGGQEEPIPFWVTAVHVLFLVWTVLNTHAAVLFVGGFLFYLAFTEATARFQDELALRPALMVGFFLAGLVVHGGLQGWWIDPVLRGLNESSLFFGATVLTAFNDNAAVTYLATFVPDFSSALEYAVVAGAVAGGGLTVIANAPNPAGQSILSRFFNNEISAWGLFLGALLPTAIMAAVFLLFP
jgi:hypothetical protein